MEIDRQALLRAFQSDADETLREMEESLVALEGRPTDPGLLQTIFRAAHNLKGSAATVGFASVAELAHVFEDLLDKLRSGAATATASLVTVLLQGRDVLRQMVDAALAGDEKPKPAHNAMRIRLRNLVATMGGAPASPASTTSAFPRPVVPAVDTAAEVAPPSAVEDAAPSPAADAARARAKTLRIDVEKLDRMLNLVGEITIARVRLERGLRRLEGAEAEVCREAHRDSDRLFLELQEMILRSRMVPLDPTFRQYIRTVRDLSSSLKKEVSLRIEGGDVEVDNAMVESLKDALTHMIRNALDHGIEGPDERASRGKARSGTLTLRAYHHAGTIVIEVEDDGAGLSRDRILARARALGILADDTAEPSDTAVHELIFHPGFSTAERITDLSGRGVGMDVVRQRIEAMRGTIEVSTRPGLGTKLSVRLPLTLAIIEGLYVGLGNDTYIVPIESVMECFSLDDRLARGQSRGVIDVRGEAIPCIRLRRYFGIEGVPGVRESVVVVRGEGGMAGLVVEALYGQRQTVIKPLAGYLRDVRPVSGCAILGSGRVALIVDVPALLREAGRGAETLTGRVA
ncbi:MAG: chemotaxis protein CheA [Acidobacteriota bacterium]